MITDIDIFAPYLPLPIPVGENLSESNSTLQPQDIHYSQPIFSVPKFNNHTASSSITSSKDAKPKCVKTQKKSKLSTTDTITTAPAITNNNMNVSYVQGTLSKSNSTTPSRSSHQQLQLFSVPSFNKSDSVVYFPSAFTRLINSNDFDELSKLFKSKMHLNCNVNMRGLDLKPNRQNLSDLFAFTLDLFPDTVMCFDSTTIIENEIRAVIYRKYTDVKAIKDGLLRTVKNPLHTTVLHAFTNREKLLTCGISTVEERESIQETINSTDNLAVFLRIEMILTLDKYSKKIINFEFIPSVASVTPQINPRLY